MDVEQESVPSCVGAEANAPAHQDLADSQQQKQIAPKEAAKNDTSNRILKRGDLARIVGRKKKLRDQYDGALGRILRQIPIEPEDDQDPNGHMFRYDVEMVLGGRLSSLERADLLYTTAQEEGMTGDARSRRTRKPSLVQEAALEAKKETTKPKKSGPKKGKQAPAVKATTKGSKKRPANDKNKASAKKAKPTVVEDPPSSAMDMYERHRREFERSVARLEKADQYHFFLGDVPDELDECYANDDPTPDTLSSSAPEPPTPSSDAQHATIDARDHASPIIAYSDPKDATTQNPASTYTVNTISQAPYNFDIIRKRMENGRYVLDKEASDEEERFQRLAPYFKSIGRRISKASKKKKKSQKSNPLVLHPKGVNWDLFHQDVLDMCDSAVERNPEVNPEHTGTLCHSANKIKDIMEQIYEKTGRRHNAEISNANGRHRFSTAMDQTDNTRAAMQAKWRRNAFPEREYERLKTDAVCAGLSELDEHIALYELKTSLKDSFVGLSYTYDDTGQSEGWMKSVMNEAGDNETQKAALALSSDDGVLRAQVAASMQSLLIGVQDRVMTETGVLEQKELKSANWAVSGDNISTDDDLSAQIVEQPVWGIDSYTCRNVSICLETEFDADTVLLFIEKWLLPAINACPEDLAHNISNAARILEGLQFDPETSLHPERSTTTEKWSGSLLGKALLNKIASSGPVWLKGIAYLLRRAYDCLGADFFRIHPKGHGSIVLCPKLGANRLVTFYKGEVYPSWRWGEKMDAIEITQERKGLKPVLPDFFNMALERPQVDPRGYGLLFVDASRKSGYGSMLSHSCRPSCEVRVAAVNGELTLAMTTLREMSIGDELTFDYNAVTESLNEYQSAVCLCGHGHCRGSFLHFATADCYQQVLNRNSPIAVRLANLIKGCMKKVMAEDDERILKSHGFQTAAFGAISVNRRKAIGLEQNTALDSMDIVPIWLRTFVADTLRYIEYERRALPIALICNTLFKETDEDEPDSAPSAGRKAGAKSNDKESATKSGASCEVASASPAKDDDKPIKGSKPEPTFFYYARTRREHFVQLLMDQDDSAELAGAELKREIQRIASSYWKELSPEEKQQWKDKAVLEWEKNGGEEKGRLEEGRIARNAKSQNSSGKSSEKKGSKSAVTKTESKKAGGPKKETGEAKLTFQAADAEGISAMEQRIQQLTQTLSRIGRVLDRHREKSLQQLEKSQSSSALIKDTVESSDSLRELVHSPMSIMPDEHVVAWMWNHKDGIVQTLLRLMQDEGCVSPSIRKSLRETESKFKVLADFGAPWIEDPVEKKEHPMSPAEGRKQVTDALLDFRMNLLDGLKEMATEIKNHKSMLRKEATRKKKAAQDEAQSQVEDPKDTNLLLRSVMDELLDSVEKRLTGQSPECTPSCTPSSTVKTEAVKVSPYEESVELDPWLQNYNKRFKLQKAADLLLIYARTSTFFALKAYQPLKSTPIEVYARELGNSVPSSAIDSDKKIEGTTKSDQSNSAIDGSSKANETSYDRPTSSDVGIAGDDNEDDDKSEFSGADAEVVGKTAKKSKSSRLCEPEDIITEVVVEYQGDYVLSQLLQWYNAGIGQKPGLPDMLGCVFLPSIGGCLTIDTTQGSSSRTDRPTRYQTHTRTRLTDWLRDPLQRGSPWPDEVRKAFVDKNDSGLISDSSGQWLPFGSPILDFLVTGDDFNIKTILETLGSVNLLDGSKSAADKLLSTVDQGRPAQAVSNWVQCENPDCLQWRRLPWYVDIDTLNEQFFCKDNMWNPASASCDDPEDEWDESADAQVDADGSAYFFESTPKAQERVTEKDSSQHACKIADFKLGARFDVFRPEKDKWSAGIVVKLDLVGQTKRVKFHFLRLDIKHDEWIEIYSSRVASLYSKTPPPLKKDPPKAEPSFSLKEKKKTKKEKKQKGKNKRKIQSLESSEKELDSSETDNFSVDDESSPQSHPGVKAEPIISLKEKKTKKEKKQNCEKKRKSQSLESSEKELDTSETDNFSVDGESSPQSRPGVDVDLTIPAKNVSSEAVKKKLKKLKKLNKSKNYRPEKTTESSPDPKSSLEHSLGCDIEPLQEKDENGFMRIPRKTSPKKPLSTQDRGIVKEVLIAVQPENGPSPVEAAASPSGSRIPRKSSSGPKISEAASLVAVVKAEQSKVPSKTETDASQFSLRRPTGPYNSSQRRSSEDKCEYNQQQTSLDDAPGETTAARKLPLSHTEDRTFSPGHGSPRGFEGRLNYEPSRRSSSSQLNLATEPSSTRLPQDIDKVHGHARDYRYSHGADRVDHKSSQERYRQGSYRDFAENHDTGRQSSQDRYAQESGRETFDDNGNAHKGAHQGYDNDSRREYADEAQEGYRRGTYRENDEDYDRTQRGSKDRYDHGSYREYDEDYVGPRQGSHGGYTRRSHREYGEDYDRPRRSSHGGYNRGSYRENGEDYDRPRQGSQGDYSRGSYREHGHRDYDNKGSKDYSNRDLYREYGEAYDKPHRGSQDPHKKHKPESFRDMASRKKSSDRDRSSHRDERPQDVHHLPEGRLSRNEPCRGIVANKYGALPGMSPRVVSESPLDFRGAEKKMNGDHR